MEARRSKRRIILTNANASVFRPAFCDTFLSELIVNALFYDEVLIREGDLIGNRHLTRFLKDKSNLATFSELLSTGAVKILRLSQTSYPSNVTFDPRQFPVSARAQDQALNRSDRGLPWVPTKDEWTLFLHLDSVLRQNRGSHQRQRPFPGHNAFAAELQELLEHPEDFRLNKRRTFRDIHPRMAKRFSEFCSQPEAWERFLRNHGQERPLATGRGFYRTQAYQCAQLFEPKARNAMECLIESTYAACECDRERAEGRYGRSALAELPNKCDDYDEAYNTVRKLEVVPIVSKEEPLKLAVAPGIGDVLAHVRDRPGFEEMQRCLLTIGSMRGPRQEYVDPEKRFTDAWSALCADYADAWAKHIRRSKSDERLGKLAAWIYVGMRAWGFLTRVLPVDLQIEKDVDITPVADYLLVDRIEHWLPVLSQYVRALANMPAARSEMVKAATLRCTRVQLHAKQNARD